MQKILNEIDRLKQEIDALRPLSTQDLGHIKEYFRVGLTYTSNALEGNALTETETKIILEEGITIGGKTLRDHLEVIGHGDALHFLYACVDNKFITEEDVKKLHRLFYYRIDESNAGVYRKSKAYITGSKYPLPLPAAIHDLMRVFINELVELRTREHPVICAAQAHKKFVFIHPFVDGNGRTARFLMNLVLMQEGYVAAMIPSLVRHGYIAALEKTHTDDGDFVMLIAQMLKETQKDYLRLFGR